MVPRLTLLQESAASVLRFQKSHIYHDGYKKFELRACSLELDDCVRLVVLSECNIYMKHIFALSGIRTPAKILEGELATIKP